MHNELAAGAGSLARRYLHAVVTADTAAAAAIVAEAGRRELGLAQLYLDVLAPALESVGRLWAAGRLTAAQEHLATEITLDQMARARQRFRPSEHLGRSAMVAAIEGEQHVVGARMVADLLEEAGWAVDFVGPNTPTADLIALIRERRSVDLLVVSVTIEDHLVALGPLCEGLRTLPSSPKLVVGGRAARTEPGLAAARGADYVAADAVDAVQAAHRLVLVPAGRNPPLERLLLALGRQIQALRTRRGWSQQTLAATAGLDRTYISAVERGKQNLTLGSLLSLAEALDAPITEILAATAQP
jgi:methanogenic corrinoid protein MtbC1/DNA-binding XRE family transcriptional regulator